MAFTEVRAKLEGITGSMSILEYGRDKDKVLQDLVELLVVLMDANAATFRASLFWQ